MAVVAIIALEQNGQRVPIARTQRSAALRVVAEAALADVRDAAAGGGDVVLSALLRQEQHRLEKAFAALGCGLEPSRRQGSEVPHDAA
jgi:hypothetical protein